MVIHTEYVGRDEAQDSKEAREVALDRLGGQELVASRGLKISSVQWNRGRGGWTVCFKEVGPR